MVLKKNNPGCTNSPGCGCGQCDFLTDSFTRPDVTHGGDIGNWLPLCIVNDSLSNTRSLPWAIQDNSLMPEWGHDGTQGVGYRYVYPDGYKRATVSVRSGGSGTVGLWLAAGGGFGSVVVRPEDQLPFGCALPQYCWAAKATPGGRFVLQLYLQLNGAGFVSAVDLASHPIYGGAYAQSKRRYWECTFTDQCDTEIVVPNEFDLAIYTCAQTYVSDGTQTNLGIYGLRDSVHAEITFGGQTYRLSHGFGVTQYGWGAGGAAFGLFTEGNVNGTYFDDFRVSKTTQTVMESTTGFLGIHWPDDDELCEQCMNCAFGLYGYVFYMGQDLSNGYPPGPDAYYTNANPPPFPDPRLARVVAGSFTVRNNITDECAALPPNEGGDEECPYQGGFELNGETYSYKWVLQPSGAGDIIASRQGFGNANLVATVAFTAGNVQNGDLNVRLYFDANEDFSQYHYKEFYVDSSTVREIAPGYLRGNLRITVGNESGVIQTWNSDDVAQMGDWEVNYHYGRIHIWVEGCRLYGNPDYTCIDLPIRGHGFIGCGTGSNNQVPVGFSHLQGACSPPENWHVCGEPHPPWDPDDPTDPPDPDDPDPTPVPCCFPQDIKVGDEATCTFNNFSIQIECASFDCILSETWISDLSGYPFTGTVVESDDNHYLVTGGTGVDNPCRPDGGEWLFEFRLVRMGTLEDDPSTAACQLSARLYQRGLNECSLYFLGDRGNPNCTGGILFLGYGNEVPTCCITGNDGAASATIVFGGPEE